MSDRKTRITFRGDRLTALLNDFQLLNIQELKDDGNNKTEKVKYDFYYQKRHYTGELYEKISIRFLAKAIQYSEASIRQCIKTNTISIEMLDSISKFLDVSNDYLKGKSDRLIANFQNYVSSNFYDMGYYSDYDEALEDTRSDFNDELERAKKTNRIDREGVFIPEYSDIKYGHFDDQLTSVLVEYLGILIKEKTFSEEQISSILPFIEMYQQRVIDELYSITKDVIHLVAIGDYITGDELIKRKEEGQDNGTD